MTGKYFQTPAVAALLNGVAPLNCLDIGARGRPLPEFDPIAGALRVFAFEPDQEECRRLNERFAGKRSGFSEIRFFPVALGRCREERELHRTRHPGSSSLLPPLTAVGEAFSRADYVEVERSEKLITEPLDEFLTARQLGPIDFLKIDTEGSELEILQAAPGLLREQLLALRLETAFLATRRGQPLYGECENFLRQHGFYPLGFEELHCWRKLSRKKYPRAERGVIPFARGQLAHGDLLFVKDSRAVLERDPGQIIKLAFILMLHGYLDHAFELMSASSLSPLLKGCDFSPATELRRLSRLQEKNFLQQEFLTLLRQLRRLPMQLGRNLLATGFRSF
ncbi:MAG: FkbM family methyltransferase [Deltaproteobacteria bacterium]|nr:FkbM family methyltransferase [Deltaproteobacteria bacterium]